MIEIVEAYTRSGNEWCTCCSKQTKTKRIKFSQNGRQGISVVLCDDCRRELVRCLSEIEDKRMIKEYEQQKQDVKEEIKVGDEVEYLICGGGLEVITNIDRGEYRLMDAYGNISYADGLRYHKRTGRHFPQIVEVLKQLRGEEEREV